MRQFHGVLDLTRDTSRVVEHGLNSTFLQVTVFAYHAETARWEQDVIPFKIIDKNNIELNMTDNVPLRITIAAF